MFRSSMLPVRHGRKTVLSGGGWEHLPSRIMSEMSTVLNRYLPLGKRHTLNVFIPRLEIVEDVDSFQVDAELPGVEADDIDITLTSDTLTIRGEKKEELEHGEEGVYCSERFFGPFSREVCLPKDVDVNRAEAVYDNGVLYINLPKVQSETGSKKIPIRCL
jgi:HSP20 family protein